MKTVWKYTLSPVSYLMIPKGSKVLFVDNQKEIAQLWALVDPSQEKESREFVVYGTGHDVPDNPGNYVGSFLMSSGSLVFHVFEQT